jgi:hypothetical protein
MQKLTLFFVSVLFTTTVFSQPVETAEREGGNSVFINKTQQKQAEALNNRKKTEDKLEVIDVTGLGGSVFSIMNYPDVSAKAGNHSLKITLSLLTGTTRTGGYQLVFLPENEKTTYAVETQNSVTSIFFPMSVFNVINQKLEQQISNKKKVQLKITQNPNGYREGVLVF